VADAQVAREALRPRHATAPEEALDSFAWSFNRFERRVVLVEADREQDIVGLAHHADAGPEVLRRAAQRAHLDTEPVVPRDVEARI
jgi:hypothetical protein